MLINVLCSCKEKPKPTNPPTRMPHHIRSIVIGVSDPTTSICWKGELKGCDPFIAISVSLCFNSTNCKHFSKVNLKPVIITVFCSWAPAIASVTLQPAEPGMVSASSFVCGTGCHPTVGNCFWVRNSDGVRQTIGIIFWMEIEKL